MIATRAAGSAAALLLAASLTSPAVAGPPFRTDDPEPVEYQHWEMTAFSQGTHVAGATSGILPGYEVNYGALANLQLHAVIPVGYARAHGGGTSFALGDIEVGAKYRVLFPGEHDWFPQIAVFPTVEVPVGNQKFGFGTGHAQIFLPIWLQKDFDPWTVYGGGGYWINPGFGNRNHAFFGATLLRKMDDRLTLGIEVFHQTSPAAGVPESSGFNVGMIYDVTDNWHVLASAGSGLQNRAATNQFSYYASIQLTF